MLDPPPKGFRGLGLLRRAYDLVCEPPSPGRAKAAAALAAFLAAAQMSKRWPQGLKDRAEEIRRLVGDGPAINAVLNPAALKDLKEKLCDFIDEVEVFVSQDHPGK